MAEDSEALSRIEKLFKSVLRERDRSTDMFNKPGEEHRDEAGRLNDSLIKTLNDLAKKELSESKKYYKELDKNIKESGAKTIDSINNAADAMKASDQAKYLKILAAKMEVTKEIEFKSKAEADEYLAKLATDAKKVGIDLDKLGVTTTTFSKTIKGGAKKITYGFNNLDAATEGVTEEYIKLQDAIQKTIEARKAEKERIDAVRGVMKKFGAVVQTIGKDLLKYGEQEARLAQQTATADAGLIDGITHLGISQSEYMKVLKDSRIANLAMTSSGLDFTTSLEESAASLENLTGDNVEASKVAVKFHNNMAMIGVSQDKLGDAVKQQTKIFKEGGAALSMTVDEFANITAEMVNSQGMRTTLLGLQEDERKAYVLGIEARYLEYRRMGYTDERAKELNKTFEKMNNNMSPKNLMKEAAKQRAAMVAMGVSAQEAQRAFNLKINMRSLGGQAKIDAQEELRKIYAKTATKLGEKTGEGSSLGSRFAFGTLAQESGLTEIAEKFETASNKGQEIDGQLLDQTKLVPNWLSKILKMMGTFSGAAGSAVGSAATTTISMIGTTIMTLLGAKMLTTITGLIFKGGIISKIISFIGGGKGGGNLLTKAFKGMVSLPGKGVELAKKGIGGAATLAGEGVKGAVKGASGIASMVGLGEKAGAKSAGKIVGKTGIKSLIKKIPGIGLLAGLGFAAGRLMDGDVMGAGLELASGALSTIPGLGTAASFGVDAALVARDMSKTPAEAIADQEKQNTTSNTTSDVKTTQEIKKDRMMSLMEQLNETMKNINAFLIANGDMTSDQASSMHNLAKAMNEQQRIFALPDGRTAG